MMSHNLGKTLTDYRDVAEEVFCCVIERSVISTSGRVLRLVEAVSAADTASGQDSGEGLSSVERGHILKVLKETFWKIEGPNGAARILGLKPSTLRSRMKKLNIRKTGEL